jgi:hypothetical protein
MVKFSIMEVLDKVLGFEDFTLKGSILFVSMTKWNVATLAKAKLFCVWAKIGGIPEDLLHYKGIYEATSPLGVVQEVDTTPMVKYKLVELV